MATRLSRCAIILAVVLAGCSSESNVQYNYNQTVDFSAFHTFDFFPLPSRAKTNPLVFERIKQGVTRELTDRGLQPSAENPDILIAILTDVNQKVDVADSRYVSNPYDSNWRRYGSGGVGSVQAYEYSEGTLIVDFVRGKDKVAIWRGIVVGVLPRSMDAETRNAIVDDAVEQVMENYPPPPED
jgi:hypothetical protein